MRAVVQRVTEAAVDVNGERIAEIGPGLLVLVGVGQGDDDSDLRLLASKMANLRIFPDAEGKMNQSILDYRYPMLVVSQFTLYGDVRKGRRPSFIDAAAPEHADALILRLVDELRELGLDVQTGQFRANMQVHLVNDGPVTIWIDTNTLRGSS